MSLSSFDILSPKITLSYNGNNCHASRIGGFLSFSLLVLLCIIIFYYFWDIFEPKYYSSFIYEDNVINDKIIQTINDSEINHFIQIYSDSNNGYFGDIDNKNIIIYAIKENNMNNYHNNNYFNLNLSNTEHWLYDKCDKLYDINELFPNDLPSNLYNFTSSICIRYYYNPINKKYYEVGFDGYIQPTLETYDLNEKKFAYKIIIEKCINNTFVNNILGYKCNTENNINKYLDIYNELFIYIFDNKIVPFTNNKPFEKYLYSISTTLHQTSYFENNIIFLPLKLIIKKGTIIKKTSNYLSYIFNSHYTNEKLCNIEYPNLLGVFNFYLDNKILTYQLILFNVIDILSNIGGLVKILFFIFQTLNYLNQRYTIIEHTKDLFKIGYGFESNIIDSKDINFENMKQTFSKNYKIKQLESNGEISPKLIRNFSPIMNKKKLLKGMNKSRLSCSKNNINLYPLNIISKKSDNNINNNNNNNSLSKQNTITFKKKKIDKRKSYLSQGYRKSKENSIIIKNQTFYENEPSNYEIQSNIINQNDIISNHNYPKESNLKFDIYEFSHINRNKKAKKTNLVVPPSNIKEKSEGNSHYSFKKPKESHNIRHKSINYTNQKKFFRNSIFNKNHLIPKNSSELINDSSKQILVNNKNLLISINNNYNKTHRYKYDENNCKGLFNNSYLINSTKNLNTLANNGNDNSDPLLFLKTLIKNKLKSEISEIKEDTIANKKIKYFEFFKSLFICSKKLDNRIHLINSFRIKLLSEEHLYRNHVNLYLIQKIFQIDEAFKFDIKELYNNL